MTPTTLRTTLPRRALGVGLAVALSVAGASAARAEERIDPRATTLLQAMCDAMGKLQTFTVEASNSLQTVSREGQKLTFEATSQVTVARPSVRSHRVGAIEEADFYYDGRTVTVYAKNANYYAQSQAPGSLDAVLDFLRDSLQIEMPAADLLYSDCYAGMTEGLTDASYVGQEAVGGVTSHHLAFRAPQVDFQVWVDAGDNPLPVKYLITSKTVTGAPEFGVELSHWNLAPKVDRAVFTFTPPAGARKIEFASPTPGSGR